MNHHLGTIGACHGPRTAGRRDRGRLRTMLVGGLVAGLVGGPVGVSQAAPMPTAPDTTPDDDRFPPPRSAKLSLGLGAGFGAVGVGGLAMLGQGLWLERQRQQQLRALQASEYDLTAYDLTPLDQQHDRARVLITVGTIASTTGLLVGGALVGLGLVKWRHHRSHSIQVAPTLGGATIRARF